MDDTFGTKLEEARTRLGISIREVADATRIRTDFLLSFENNHGNFDMPEVYKHGFLKLYARHLKLDPQEVLNDFIAYHQGNIKHPRRETKEPLARIDLPVSELTQAPAQINLPLGPTEPTQASPKDELSKREAGPIASLSNLRSLIPKSLYVKIGLIFGGTIALFIFIATLLNSIISPSQSKKMVEVAMPSQPAGQDGFPAVSYTATTADALAETLTLRGEEDVHVVVRQENDKQRLFSGNIEQNTPITITRQGPVKIHFSNGQKLVIEKPNGQQVRPGRQGAGWIEI